MSTDEILHIDHDGNWKILIDNLPFEFIDFFLPIIYPYIDKNIPPTFLDKEFHEIIKDLTLGKTVKDKLMSVKLIDGNDCCLIIHIEVQSSFEK